MRVGVAAEGAEHDRRVVLVPQGVSTVTAAGYEILVERDAGAGIGLEDAAYEAAGARVVDQDRLWATCELVVKYRAPLEREYGLLRPGQHVAAVMHAEGDMRLVAALRTSNVTAYAWEFVQEAEGSFPLMAPGGEIAGRMAVLYGAFYSQSHLGGSGSLLGHIPSSPPYRVVVIGHGHVGGSAARTAAALGASVIVLGRTPHRLRAFQATVPGDVRCELLTKDVLEREVQGADLVVGAILESTWDTPTLVPEGLVRQMRPGSVLIDATAGYGPGYMPTFGDRLTTPDCPVFERFGVLHCKIDAFPRSVPITASHAVSAVVAPYVVRLATMIANSTPDEAIEAACIVKGGRVVHSVVQRHVAMAARPPS